LEVAWQRKKMAELVFMFKQTLQSSKWAVIAHVFGNMAARGSQMSGVLFQDGGALFIYRLKLFSMVSLIATYPLFAGALSDAANQKPKDFEAALKVFSPASPRAVDDVLDALSNIAKHRNVDILRVFLSEHGRSARSTLTEYFQQHSHISIEHLRRPKEAAIVFFQSLFQLFKQHPEDRIDAKEPSWTGRHQLELATLATQFANAILNTRAFAADEIGSIYAGIIGSYAVAVVSDDSLAQEIFDKLSSMLAPIVTDKDTCLFSSTIIQVTILSYLNLEGMIFDVLEAVVQAQQPDFALSAHNLMALREKLQSVYESEQMARQPYLDAAGFRQRRDGVRKYIAASSLFGSQKSFIFADAKSDRQSRQSPFEASIPSPAAGAGASSGTGGGLGAGAGAGLGAWASTASVAVYTPPASPISYHPPALPAPSPPSTPYSQPSSPPPPSPLPRLSPLTPLPAGTPYSTVESPMTPATPIGPPSPGPTPPMVALTSSHPQGFLAGVLPQQAFTMPLLGGGSVVLQLFPAPSLPPVSLPPNPVYPNLFQLFQQHYRQFGSMPP
jgi:hypothetical protein